MSIHHRLLSTKSKYHRPFVGIIGGGPTGLFLSILLSRYNVRSILFERATPDERFRHPQAHFLNTRTMEIFRHTVPEIYQLHIQKEIPPVEQWKYFRFGASVLDPHAVVVEHPVDRPLQANEDANGVLLDKERRNEQQERTRTSNNDLSPVSVGHLAQHKLGKILYDTARTEEHTSIHFGTMVDSITTHAEEEDNDGVTIHTANQGSHTVDLCVGADGAHSMVRQTLGIPLHGPATIQHLINVHVKVPREWAAQRIHNNQTTCAMLYSVFTQNAVAMVVCHDIGEYIVQIPYFPPFQTMEEDFGTERIGEILHSIFGIPIDPDQHVVSVRPWTMGSLVAERFAQDHCLLVGDAAHIFPPAGGLGMNTGLQDVHNVAWKIAHSTVTSSSSPSSSSVTSSSRPRLAAIAASYAVERRPIAQQNAALSVRNYKRLLEVTKAAYLDRQHPALLQQLLEHSPLPLPMQRQTFRTLLQTALHPFSWLGDEDSIFGRHVRSNLRTTLRSGTGLPLLFPNYEIGFCYEPETSPPSSATAADVIDEGLAETTTAQHHWSQDTLPTRPGAVRVGALVPHVVLEVIAGAEPFHLLQYLLPSCSTSMSSSRTRRKISSVDLPSQLRSKDCPPNYVLLYNRPSSLQEAQSLVKSLVQTELLLLNSDTSIQLVLITDVILETRRHETVLQLRSPDEDSDPPYLQQLRAVLIRPDGHVAKIIEK